MAIMQNTYAIDAVMNRYTPQIEQQIDRYHPIMANAFVEKLDRIHRLEDIKTFCPKGQALMDTLEAATDEAAWSKALIYLDVHVFGVDGGGCEVCG